MPEERPHQILQAALEVFDEYGLVGARIEDIAKRAGVSKGTIYLYFPNKEALFREMIQSTIVAAIAAGEQMPDTGTATEQLVAYMREYWDFARSHAFGTVYRLVISELHRFPDLSEFYVNEVVLRMRQLVGRIIGRGIEAGEFRAIDTAVATRMLASLFGTNVMWCTKRKFFPHIHDKTDEQVFAEIADFYVNALRV
ncbi:MAG TPA: TetR/AcrR family transcriptional regulator [Gemmatimonadaceae bacterium]|nr:TetR/AcrR family transcriptional regulator [Gemmatimonadaceae bacterium]